MVSRRQRPKSWSSSRSTRDRGESSFGIRSCCTPARGLVLPVLRSSRLFSLLLQAMIDDTLIATSPGATGNVLYCVLDML
jgi:hypothetical protein